MISALCSCCGSPAEAHHDDYADGTGWFCEDCFPRAKGHAVRVVNQWQAVTASHTADDPPRTGVVIPNTQRRRARLRGAA